MFGALVTAAFFAIENGFFFHRKVVVGRTCAANWSTSHYLVTVGWGLDTLVVRLSRKHA